MKRSVVVALVVVCLCTATVGMVVLTGMATAVEDSQPEPAVAAVPADGGDITAYPSMEADSQSFDSTTFEITVYENGSAAWTFRHERILTSSEEEAQFETFAEEFEDEETELYTQFVHQAEALTDTGTEQTDREMDATQFNRSASVEHRPGIPDDSMGVVEMTFLWTAFAETTDTDQIVVGDVFEGGLYISSDQSLVVFPGDNLVFTHVHPEGEYTAMNLEDATSITWTGEHEFPTDQPRIVFEHEDAVGGADDGGNTETADTRESTWSILGVIGVFVLALLGVGAWYRRHSDPESTATDAPVADDSAPDEGPVEDPFEDELITDEDRVVTLIQQNGGRMKQVDIVEETGWSKSKVSMLLSEMESEGTISKLRVGRENIISLEGFEPEATKSPFDQS